MTWDRVLKAVRMLGRGLLDVLYPSRCLGCGGRPASSDLPLCPRCIQSLERAKSDDVWERLDRLPVTADVFEEVFSLWVFDKQSVLQEVQHAVKYENRPRYGVPLGRLMGRGYSRSHPAPDGIIPVPLHRLRELERGYNQSRMLARGLGDEIGRPVREDLLTRPRHTKSQTGLSREERWRNVRAAFSASEECSGGHWLIVDDVLTTGSTAVAAADTVSEAGADSVYLATLGLARR